MVEDRPLEEPSGGGTMSWKYLFLLFVSNTIYIVFGGVVFHFLEKDEEDKNRETVRDAVSDFIDQHECVTREEVDDIIQRIVTAYNQGILAVNNATSTSRWKLTNAIFFSGTVITTIGYGNLSPSSKAGRHFCCFYALFGIPMMMVMLAVIGEKLRLLAGLLELRALGCRYRPKVLKATRCILLIAVGAALLLIVPAAIFRALEGWTMDESLYFGFITLSTIGFGDYVAGTSEYGKFEQLYMACLPVWVVIGLAWLAGVLATLQDLVEALFHKVEDRALQAGQRGCHAEGAAVSEAGRKTALDSEWETEGGDPKRTTGVLQSYL